MVKLQPVSARPIVETFVEGLGIAGGYEKFDKPYTSAPGSISTSKPQPST